MSEFTYVPITDEEAEQVMRETARRDRIEPRIERAVYDAATATLRLEMCGGATVTAPIARLQALQDAGDEALADMRIRGNGASLHWNTLDVQMTTTALLGLIFGIRSVSEHARRAGQARSEAKSASSRENGKKGGRPRSKVEAAS